MSESVNSANSAMQIFNAPRTMGSVWVAEQSTNYQRISNLSLTIRPFRVAILAVLLVFVAGWNSEVWGNTAATNKSGNDVSGGKIVISGNHATFTLSAAGHSIEYVGSPTHHYSLGNVSSGNPRNCTFTWEANGGCSIKVTNIKFGVRGYTPLATRTGRMKAKFNGTEKSVGSIGTSLTNFNETNNSGFANGSVLQIWVTTSNYDFWIGDISITYTITPDAPTIKATTETVNVSLTNENKLDMTNLIGVADVTDFMPVSFESNSFTQTGGVGSAAGVFDGKYFYATQAGVYKYNNPYIASKENCHVKSNTTNGTITITVNRLAQSLTMKNSSVNVTTDKSNPVTLDLSKLINSHTGNGNVTYSLVSGPTSLSGDAAADNCKINGNNFYAWVGGVYTLRATASKTAQYNEVTSSDFTVTVNRLTQTISWTPANLETEPFVEEDVVTATSIGDVTLTKSGAGAEYVTIEGNTATVGEVEENSSVTLTATAAQTDVYAETTDSKTITLTSLQKQHITFNQNLTKLKTTDGTKKVELVATSDSGRDSYITFAVDANAAGVSVTHEGDKWYLNYTATAVKGIAVTASLAGVEGVSIAASDVSQMVKVTDPTAKCDITETLATAYGIKSTDKVYDLTIPKEVVLKVRCSEKSLTLLQGYDIKFYNAQNQQVGSTQSYGVTDGHYNTQAVQTRTFSNLDKNITKMVFTSNASKGYDITEASYTRWSYANPSKSELSFEAYALSTVEDQTFTLDYANYQIELSIEGSSNFVLKSADSFGDCETYGSETIRVGYNVPAEAIEETAYLYIRDNTGAELGKITLNATVIGGLTQNITSTNIQSSYLTTDLVNLTATTDRGLTNFSYSASPAGIANFNGSQMTFSQSGTIAITVTEAGNGAYAEASTTVENVVVSKATPVLTAPTSGTEIQYLQTLNNSAIANDGVAKVTLRGVENTVVEGTWAWSNPTQVIKDNAGTHAYEVTFTPTDGGMYTTNTCMVPVTILRAAQAIAMNNGAVKVAVDGIDAGKADSYLDLNSLIQSQTTDVVDEVKRDGNVTYAVISANADKATIDGSTFSATEIGDYTIRATKSETGFYNEAMADFTVSVTKRANTMATAAAYTQYVDDEVENVATVVNSDGEIHTSSTDATIAYYDIANNKIVIPNSEAKSFDQTEVTIKIWQDGTTRFEAIAEADAKTITLTVKKHENPFACSWDAWTYTANFEEVVQVEFTTANTDYTNFPIVITQTSGENVATLVNNDATHNTITASYVRDNATWHLSQAESYKYKAGAQDVSMLVRTLPATCYIFEDNTEHSFETSGLDFTGHYDDPIAISGPAKAISFEAIRQFGGVNNFIAEYSVDNCSSWRTIMEPDLDYSWGQTYTKNFSEIGLGENERVTHIRFGAKTGATLSKWYRNIKVTRATNIKPLDKENNLITAMTMPQNTVGGSTTEKFYMKFSSCDEVVKLASNNSHFTLDKVEIARDPSKDETEAEVTVTYSSDEVGTHNGVITLYTKYQNRTFTVSGTTAKKVQTIEWKEGFTGDPLTLQKGLVVNNVNIAATASSERPVIYTTDNEEVIEIILNGLGFRVIGEGSANLTASEAGDAVWAPVSETKTIIATGKPVQTILWDQNLVNDLELGQVKELDAKVYIRDAATGDLTYNAERTALINYSCPANTVISLEGNTITVTGYGLTTITATVAGNSTYVEAQPVVVSVRVREPSAGCETPLVLNHPENVRLYSTNFIAAGLNYTTPEVVSQIDLDRTKGKPDKLSYKHNGELASIPVFGAIKLCGGAVKVQERVNGSWYDVEGSYFDNEGKTGNKADYNWRDVMDLQLNENADAIRFVRLEHGSGAHNFKDIQITLLQYVRPVQAIIEAENVLDLGDIEVGEAHAAVVSFDYSDVKGEILATKGNTEDAVLELNEKTIYLDCGSHGQHDLPITLRPTVEGEWSNTVTLTDRLTNVATTITVRANVVPGKKYTFNGGEDGNSTQWGTSANWEENEKPGAHDNVIIQSDVEIIGNVTVGSLTIDEGATVTVTVTGNLTIGDGNSYLQTGYGDLHVVDGGSVTMGNGVVIVRDLILDAALGSTETGGSSGQFSDEKQKMVLDRDAYFQMDFDPSGQVTYGWYDFTVPFEVNIKDGIFRQGESEHLVDGTDFLVMEHSESARAAGKTDWKMAHGTMYPGRVYTITLDDEVTQNTILFKKKKGAALGGSNDFSAQCSSGDADKRGWNGLGNGTMHHTQLNGLASGTKVQLYDHTNNVYVPRNAGQLTYAVGTSFFMQVDGAQTITLSPATNGYDFLAPARESRVVEEFRLGLTEDATEKKADVLYISASEEATEAYVIGHDLIKMGTPAEAKVAQMWAVKGDYNLCDVEAEMVNSNSNTPLALYAPKAGNYTLAVEEAPEDAMLYLTYEGTPIWNLSYSPYVFDLAKGKTEGYGLRIYAQESSQITTGVEEVDGGKDACTKVVIDQTMYIITPDGAMYSVTGKKIK